MPGTCECVFAEEMRVSALQFRQNLEHRIRVARWRQRAVDRAKPLLTPAESAAAVGLDERHDRADLLRALPGFVNRLIAGRIVRPQGFARASEFPSRHATKAGASRFFRSQVIRHILQPPVLSFSFQARASRDAGSRPSWLRPVKRQEQHAHVDCIDGTEAPRHDRPIVLAGSGHRG